MKQGMSIRNPVLRGKISVRNITYNKYCEASIRHIGVNKNIWAYLVKTGKKYNKSHGTFMPFSMVLMYLIRG